MIPASASSSLMRRPAFGCWRMIRALQEYLRAFLLTRLRPCAFSVAAPYRVHFQIHQLAQRMRTQANLTAVGRTPKGARRETRRHDVMKGTSGEMGSNQSDFLPSSDETPLVLIIEDEQPIA